MALAVHRTDVEMMETGARTSDSRRLAEFTHRLAAARRRLARTVATTDAELEGAAPDVMSAILARLEGRGRHELDEIDAAQARLEAGLFGVCEDCHQAIPLARLRAMPAARHCATCQIHQEAGR